MSYKDDEEIVGEVDINEDEVDILATEDIDDPLLVDDDLLVDDELLEEEDEELEELAGLDGSEY